MSQSQPDNAKSINSIRAGRPVDIYKDLKSNITEDEFRKQCGAQNIWHSVDLGDVFIEGARKTSEVLARENNFLAGTDFKDKTVLDIGAFTGWFSFEAERRGAAEVTALDYYSWIYDWPSFLVWLRKERQLGNIPDPYSPPQQFVDETTCPGRLVLDTTKEILGSKVKTVTKRLNDYNSDPFDITLFLGVLYHTEDPLETLRKVADLTKSEVIVETLGKYVPGADGQALWEFYAGDEVRGDPTTWWAPNELGLKKMMEAAGFKDVKILAGSDVLTDDQRTRPQAIRIWATGKK